MRRRTAAVVRAWRKLEVFHLHKRRRFWSTGAAAVLAHFSAFCPRLTSLILPPLLNLDVDNLPAADELTLDPAEPLHPLTNLVVRLRGVASKDIQDEHREVWHAYMCHFFPRLVPAYMPCDDGAHV